MSEDFREPTLESTKERSTAFKLPDPAEAKQEAVTKVVETTAALGETKKTKKEATIPCTLCTRKYCYQSGLERHMREAHADASSNSTEAVPKIPAQLPSKLLDNSVGPEVRVQSTEQPVPERKMQDPLPSAPQPRALPPLPQPKPSPKIAKAGRWF